MTGHDQPGLLAGVRVTEFSQLVAAPYCGLTLADLGADVVKVESKYGDYVRTWAREGEPSALFQALNRNKRAVQADLRTEPGRELARNLILASDVVIENYGDAAAQTLGIGYDEAAAANPRLIWCSISGLGHGSGGRAVDMTLQASIGITALTGPADGAPCRAAIPVVDLMTGMYAVQAVLEAVIRLERTGQGALLDCAMLDAAAMLTVSPAALSFSGFSSPRRMGSESDLFVPSAVFATADDRYVHVLALGEAHWRAICTAIGRPEWIADPRFTSNSARLAHRQEIHTGIADILRTRTAAQWAGEIKDLGGFCEHVRDIEEAWSDPLLRERGLLIEPDTLEGIKFPVPIASLVRRRSHALARAPELGEHTTELMTELESSRRTND